MPSTRRRRHLGLAGFVAFVCVAALVLTLPVHGPLRGLSFGLGYASLALLLLTLAIGPWTVIRGRQMPVSTMFRRDVGIWAGLTGCLHVGFGLQSHFGGRIVRYFFLDGSGWVPDLSPFGLANWVGAGATLILVGLLLLSNTLSLRVLGAGRWKSWQRLNYLLAVLTILHTVGYQVIGDRGRAAVVLTFGAAVGVGLLQILGFLQTRQAAEAR